MSGGMESMSTVEPLAFYRPKEWLVPKAVRLPARRNGKQEMIFPYDVQAAMFVDVVEGSDVIDVFSYTFKSVIPFVVWLQERDGTALWDRETLNAAPFARWFERAVLPAGHGCVDRELGALLDLVGDSPL